MKTPVLLDLLAVRDDTVLRETLSGVAASGWRDLVEEAIFHEVEAVLHDRVASLGSDSPVPRSALSVLEQRFGIHALRARVLGEELAAILDGLGAAAVPVIVLKGAYLAWCVYPHPAMRSMGDVDLLVPASHLLRARDVLLGLGYSAGDDVASHHLPPMRKTNATTVELHWTVEAPSSPFVVDVEGLWQRAIRVQVAGRATQALSRADLIVHLALHLTWHHRFGTYMHQGLAFKHLYDLAAVLSFEPGRIDWPQICSVANASGAAKQVYCALTVVQHLFRLTLPPSLRTELEREPDDDRMARGIVQMLQSRPAIDPDGYAEWAQRRGLVGRARLARRKLFPGMIEVARMHEVRPWSPRAWQHVIERPMRLVARYAWTAANLRLRTPSGRAVRRHQTIRAEIDRWISTP